MEVTTFKGLRNDKGKRYVEPNYFFDIKNFNYADIIGANKIKFPKIIYDGYGTENNFGIFEYRYLDQSNVLRKESITIIENDIYKTFENGAPISIYSGLTKSKARAVAYQDKLFITNGKNYPLIYNGATVYEMGAPEAIDKIVLGNLNGSYYYEMTYVTSGGEERIGTRSNTISIVNGQTLLNIPIGYAGTTSRKIYRTIAGGSVPKLLATIADNTTLTYIDNVVDGSLSTNIIEINNECPRPYFLEVNYEKLIGCKFDKYPTQLSITGANIELFDLSNNTDISNQSGDNSPVVGMAIDYNRLVVGSENEIYLVDVSGSSVSVNSTRSNLGMLDGYTVVRVPTGEGYTGGVMFVSSLYDIRQFTGNIAQPVATSLDNLTTTDLTQIIKNTFEEDVKNSSNLYASFYDNQYHLVVDQKYYIYDIRIGGWSKYFIKTSSYVSEANVLGIYDSELYIGGKNNSLIEKMYQETTYRGEEVTSFIETPQLLYSKEEEKYIKELRIFYKNLSTNKWNVTITINSKFNNNGTIVANFVDGSYLSESYDSNYYETVETEDDYRVIHINEWAKWIEFKIEPQEGLFYFRGYSLIVEEVSNKEERVY